VIEAGELKTGIAAAQGLRGAPGTAVAIGCYPDGERELAKLIDDELRLSSLPHGAGRGAAALTALLGGDRQALAQ